MINLNTFQLRLIKFYILPIFFFGLIVSYNFTYTLSKNFIDNITFKKEVKEIKEIQRKNLKINGIELKKWTVLTESQKEYFLENETEKLEDKEKFKIKYKSEYITENLTDENIDENYNFILFIQVLFSSFKLGLILIFLIPFIFLYLFYKKYYLTKLKPLEKFYNLRFYMSNLNSSNNIQSNNKLENIKNMDKFLKYDEKNKEYLFKTNSILQRNLYLNNKEEIEKYLKIENLKIVQDDLIIKISEKSISKFIKFDENNYKQNQLFLGKSENNKEINLDINGLKHTILIGESGSGKSVFVQSMLLSIFKNLDKYEKIFLVDFKLVEMIRYENTNEKIEVVSEINDFVELTEKLNYSMFER